MTCGFHSVSSRASSSCIIPFSVATEAGPTFGFANSRSHKEPYRTSAGSLVVLVFTDARGHVPKGKQNWESS